MLFSSFGYETLLQPPFVAVAPAPVWKRPRGATRAQLARFACKIALCWMATNPATWGCEFTPQFVVQGTPGPGGPGGGVLANWAPLVLKSGPADAVLLLKTMVLLMTFTLGASSSEIPPPSQPATLFATILLVNVTVFHCPGSVGKATISEPLTAWKATPPPYPLSAVFPRMRLPLITNPGPTPSLGPTPESGVLPELPPGAPKGTQSWSMPLGLLGRLQTRSASGVPMTIRPPPLAGIVGLLLWLKMIVLC